MYQIEYTNQFKKDYSKVAKKNLDLKLIDGIITKLVHQTPLAVKHRPHKLSGQYSDCWECHIKPDWLLIWRLNDATNTLTLIRTGSHSDLF
jgi:mRNA interferase YafQ